MYKEAFAIVKKVEKFLDKDKYPEMTREAVKKLWNDERYTKEGLLNIAIALLRKIMES